MVPGLFSPILDAETCTVSQRIKSAAPKIEVTDESNYSDCDQQQQSADSGVDADIIEPSEELMRKIVNQVESYFSDENLVNDAFLLKHVRRNKEGFVNIKLIASFRKVKPLTKSWEIVAHSVKRFSRKLMLNENHTKVRRIEPFTSDIDGSFSARTIVAYNLSACANQSTLHHTFAPFGTIRSIRIVDAEKTLPLDLAPIMDKCVEVKSGLFALVEFESKTSVEKSVKELADLKRQNWRQSMTVVPLKVKSTKKSTTESQVNNNKYNRKQLSRTSEGQDSQTMSRQSQHTFRNFNMTAKVNTRKVGQLERQKSSSFSEGISNPKFPVNVIRFPRGPDGTTGFLQLKDRSNSEPTSLQCLG